MEVLGLAPPSRPPPPPANPVQATRSAPPPGPSNVPPKVSDHDRQLAVSTRLSSPGTTTTKKEKGPIHSAKAEEILMFVSRYVCIYHLYPFTFLHCMGVIETEGGLKIWLDCFDGLVGPAE